MASEQESAPGTLRERSPSPGVLRYLFDHCADGIFLSDERGRLIEVNARGCELAAYSREEILKLSLSDLVPPEDRPRDPPHSDELRAGKTVVMECRLRRNDGSLLSVEIRARNLPDGSTLSQVRDITQRKLSEAALAQTEIRWSAVFNNNLDLQLLAAVEPDGEFRIVAVNRRYIESANRHGVNVSAGGLIGKTIRTVLRDHFGASEEVLNSRLQAYRQAADSGLPVHYETDFRTTGGRLRADVTIAPIFDETGVCRHLLWSAHDIAARKRAETRIQHLTRLYATLSQVNQAIVRTKDRDCLFQAICDACVKFGKFRMAWIGLIGHPADSLKAVACSGLEDLHPAALPLSAAGIARGLGASGRALQDGALTISDDIETDPLTLPWRAEALQHGYRSSASVPFREGGRVVGSLNLYAAEPNFFSQEEKNLLEEIGVDISYALDAVSAEAQRAQAAEALRVALVKYKTLFDAFPLAITVADPLGRILESNLIAQELLGLSLEEQARRGIAGQEWQVVRPDGSPMPVGEFASVRALKEKRLVKNVEMGIVKPTGEIAWISVTAAPLSLEGYGVVISYSDISERRRAEQLLQESRARLETIVRNAPVILFCLDKDGVFTLSEGKGLDALGLQPGEVVGRSALEVYRDYPAITGAVRRALDGEVLATVHDMGIWAVDIHYAPLRNEQGSVIGVIGIATDITARIRAEEGLHRRNRQLGVLSRASQEINTVLEIPVILRQLVSSALELTGATSGAAGRLLDGQMVFTEYNRQGQLLPIDLRFAPGVGVPGSVMRNRTHYLTNSAALDPQVPPEIREALSFSNLADVPIFSKRGDLFGCFEVHDKPGGFDDTDVLLLQGLASSAAIALENAEMLDARRRSEAALRESEARFRTTLYSIGDGVITADTQGLVVQMNHIAEVLTGWKESDAFGKPLNEVFRIHNEGTGEAAASPVDRVLSEGATTALADRTVLVARDGIMRPISDSGAPIRDEYGHITGVVLVFSDQTERRDLQAQFLQAQKMEAVGRLAGGIAHDFNNMIGVILGYANLIQNRLPPQDPAYQYVQAIATAAERSANLTRQLLAFARKQVVAPVPLNLNEWLSTLHSVLIRLVGEDISLSILPGNNLWNVLIDPSQLDQILTNLSTNARDAIDDVGSIVIQTANVAFDKASLAVHTGVAPGDYVMLEFADNGKGMDEVTQARIFEPFFTTKPRGQGTGLGLATVFGIVQQNNGFLKVSSEPGAGTIFRIYLPRLRGESTVSRDVAPPDPLRGAETVLVVEDEQQLLDLARMLLESLGYKVLTASSPAAAIALVESTQEKIDLLLTDVIMPGMNGHELKRRLETLRPRLRTAFMSGYAADVIAHRGVLDEGVSFLQKPFTPVSLALAVQKALAD